MDNILEYLLYYDVVTLMREKARDATMRAPEHGGRAEGALKVIGLPQQAAINR